MSNYDLTDYRTKLSHQLIFSNLGVLSSYILRHIEQNQSHSAECCIDFIHEKFQNYKDDVITALGLLLQHGLIAFDSPPTIDLHCKANLKDDPESDPVGYGLSCRRADFLCITERGLVLLKEWEQNPPKDD